MIDEQTKSNLVEMSEKLAEAALTGAVDRAILVTLGPNGMNSATVNITMLEAIGALQLTLAKTIMRAQ